MRGRRDGRNRHDCHDALLPAFFPRLDGGLPRLHGLAPARRPGPPRLGGGVRAAGEAPAVRGEPDPLTGHEAPYPELEAEVRAARSPPAPAAWAGLLAISSPWSRLVRRARFACERAVPAAAFRAGVDPMRAHRRVSAPLSQVEREYWRPVATKLIGLPLQPGPWRLIAVAGRQPGAGAFAVQKA